MNHCAIADTFTTDEDTSFTTGNVLNNDTDVERDTLTVSAIDDSETIGLVTDNGDGTFNYDPNGQFESLNEGETATDSFSYTVRDGNGGTDNSTVTITLNGITDPTDLVFGTLENDSLEAGIDFDGEGDLVFTGTGEDEIFASQGEGENRIYTGSDNDELFAGTRDRVFGGTGNDTLDASVGNGENRLYGGAGDDDFLLGANDRLIGNEGSDRFFTGTGGDNVITGGTGADQFWIAMPTARSATYAEIPNSANTITDLTSGEDAIGFGGFPELTFADLTLTQEDSSTVISLGADTEFVEEDERDRALTWG